MLMETHLWLCDLVYIKMTDNRLGFGKKLIWMKDAKLNAPGSADK
jgi:uncharacterized protein YhbP (UPF0306 family)